MKKYAEFLLVLIVLIPLTGCSALFPAPATPTMAPTFTPIVMPTEIPLPTAAPIQEPTPTFTPEPTSTPAAVSMLDARVVFDSYILRTGPGRLFERIAMYDTDAEVTLIGREFSNNWVLVQTADNRSGWMNVVGLEIQGALGFLPVFEVKDAQVIYGHVYLQSQVPAQGIGVSLASTAEDLADSVDNSTTNADGLWAIYLPDDISGEYYIGPNAYACENSNAVIPAEGGCILAGKLPDGQLISLPLDLDVAIEFQILPLAP